MFVDDNFCRWKWIRKIKLLIALSRQIFEKIDTKDITEKQHFWIFF